LFIISPTPANEPTGSGGVPQGQLQKGDFD
jgi:hypothetical protein